MKYFTIKELSHSDTAVAHAIDNTPTGEVVHNLTEPGGKRPRPAP